VAVAICDIRAAGGLSQLNPCIETLYIAAGYKGNCNGVLRAITSAGLTKTLVSREDPHEKKSHSHFNPGAGRTISSVGGQQQDFA
jgi:hypothetical protein